MGVKSHSVEVSSPVAPGRLFKALCLDSHNLFPQLLPESFESIEFLQGDCAEVGAIKHINFAPGHPFQYVRQRYDEIDEENFYCKSTTIEGTFVGDRVDFVVSEARFVPSGSGSDCLMTSHYHPRGDVLLDDEKIKFGEEKMNKLFKVVEEYLLANPDVYA